ncbi:MAG TPA: hypothetical protein V6D11_12435 [Waterburya sp.]|jgi:hypothetical protein
MESNIFHTPYGEAVVTERGVFHNPYTNVTSIEYDCFVIKNDGIAKGQTIAVRPGEQLTQQLVESAASCTTPEGRAANRRHNDEIRQFIRKLKGLPGTEPDQ